MRKIRWIVLGLMLAAVCAVILYVTVPQGSPLEIPAEAIVYTDAYNNEPTAMELFLDEMQWGMPDLLQQELYLAGDEINMDFWFSKSASPSQMDGARSFAITALVLRHAHALGASPYQELVNDMEITWKTVSCKVYRGRKLLYHDRYDENHRLIK
jgi:hypothetical protein